MSLHKYSTTPASNTSVGDGGDAVGIQEGMPRGNVNNAMRAMASDLAKYLADQGALTTSGSGSAYTVTGNSDYTEYFNGMSLVLKLHADCAADATINVSGRGAKSLRMRGASGMVNVKAGSLRANEIVHLVYDGANFCVVGAWDESQFLSLTGGTMTGNLVLPNHGIYLGGSGSANFISDYEEGTWAPILSSTGIAPVLTYSVRTGRYVKIGKLCFFSFRIAVTAVNAQGSGTQRITNLPFTAANYSNIFGGANVLWATGYPSGETPNAGYVNANSTFMDLSKRNSADARDLQTFGPNAANIGASTGLIMSGCYITT